MYGLFRMMSVPLDGTDKFLKNIQPQTGTTVECQNYHHRQVHHAERRSSISSRSETSPGQADQGHNQQALQQSMDHERTRIIPEFSIFNSTASTDTVSRIEELLKTNAGTSFFHSISNNSTTAFNTSSTVDNRHIVNFASSSNATTLVAPTTDHTKAGTSNSKYDFKSMFESQLSLSQNVSQNKDGYDEDSSSHAEDDLAPIPVDNAPPLTTINVTKNQSWAYHQNDSQNDSHHFRPEPSTRYYKTNNSGEDTSVAPSTGQSKYSNDAWVPRSQTLNQEERCNSDEMFGNDIHPVTANPAPLPPPQQQQPAERDSDRSSSKSSLSKYNFVAMFQNQLPPTNATIATATDSIIENASSAHTRRRPTLEFRSPPAWGASETTHTTDSVGGQHLLTNTSIFSSRDWAPRSLSPVVVQEDFNPDEVFRTSNIVPMGQQQQSITASAPRTKFNFSAMFESHLSGSTTAQEAVHNPSIQRHDEHSQYSTSYSGPSTTERSNDLFTAFSVPASRAPTDVTTNLPAMPVVLGDGSGYLGTGGQFSEREMAIARSKESAEKMLKDIMSGSATVTSDTPEVEAVVALNQLFYSESSVPNQPPLIQPVEQPQEKSVKSVVPAQPQESQAVKKEAKEKDSQTEKSKQDGQTEVVKKKPKRIRKRPNYEPSVKIFVVPTPSDVLMGRGGRTNHHHGNHLYLQAKTEIQPRYLAASKEEKTTISQELVDVVHKWGGRFLKQDDGGADLWYQVANIQARKKASQTLREQNTPEARAAKRAKYQPKGSKNRKDNSTNSGDDSEDSDSV